MWMMYRLVYLLFMCFWFSGAAQPAPEIRKQNLKVLYVGNRPDMPLPDYYTAQLGAERFSDYNGRMEAFRSML